MPSTRDLLQRFRPAATPGAASATGVPADRLDERAAELAGVFAALASTVAESDRIRREADAEAERRREGARDDVTSRLARARHEAELVRAQAVAQAHDEIASSVRGSLAAAERRAREIGQEAAHTRADDVAAVVAAVRARALDADRAEVAP
jgi:hypothetical protein